MSVSKRNYIYDGITYEGTITRKRMKSIIMRASLEKKTISISCPYLTSDKEIDKFVIERFPSLLKRLKKRAISPLDEEGIYILGKKEALSFTDEKEKTAYLKKVGLDYLNQKVPYYENMMGIKRHYKIRVRQMKSRYGSNSKSTYSLSFSTFLFHFAPETIDCVIIHELAHHFQMNHGPKFYRIVFAYCPNYKQIHARLRKREYAASSF